MAVKLVGGQDVEKFRRSEAAFNKRVGGILKKSRLAMAAPLSLAAVGAALGGLNETQVMRYEDGTTPLKVVTAYRMCQLYGIGMEELFK